MQTTFNRYLYPDGSVNMHNITNLTGTFACPLVNRIWEQSGHNERIVDSLFQWLEQLFDSGQETEFMNMLKLVCGILGHAFAGEITAATQNPQIRNAFIVSFLSDYDDALLDLSDE